MGRGRGHDVFNMTIFNITKSSSNKNRSKWVYIKLKSFFTAKETINEMRR
jgi:hypothetical protein